MADRIPTSNSKFITVTVELAALGTAKTRGVCSPVTGHIVHMGIGVHTAVDANNVVKGTINGTDITGLSATLTTSETAGKTKQAYPSAPADTAAGGYVKRGDYLAAVTDGGGSVGDAMVTFTIEQA